MLIVDHRCSLWTTDAHHGPRNNAKVVNVIESWVMRRIALSSNIYHRKVIHSRLCPHQSRIMWPCSLSWNLTAPPSGENRLLEGTGERYRRCWRGAALPFMTHPIKQDTYHTHDGSWI